MKVFAKKFFKAPVFEGRPLPISAADAERAKTGFPAGGLSFRTGDVEGLEWPEPGLPRLEVDRLRGEPDGDAVDPDAVDADSRGGGSFVSTVAQ